MSASKRFTKILLATDGSEQAQSAVEATIAIAAPFVTVMVVHVWNLEIHPRHDGRDIEVRSEAEHLVDATVDGLLAAGIIAEREICRSDDGHVAAPSRSQPSNSVLTLWWSARAACPTGSR
jgi:hypothetical protein